MHDEVSGELQVAANKDLQKGGDSDGDGGEPQGESLASVKRKIVKRHHGSATAVAQKTSLPDEYGMVNLAGKDADLDKSPIRREDAGVNQSMTLKNARNFPLDKLNAKQRNASIFTELNYNSAKNLEGSAATKDAKKSVFESPSRVQAKMTSSQIQFDRSAGGALKVNKSLMHVKSLALQKAKQKSSETLVIGGIIRQGHLCRNQSAMSKEYHSRHTRHMRAGSTHQMADKATMSGTTQHNIKNVVKSSLPSSIYHKDSIEFAKMSVMVDEERGKPADVPTSVLDWYNTMIAPAREVGGSRNLHTPFSDI